MDLRQMSRDLPATDSLELVKALGRKTKHLIEHDGLVREEAMRVATREMYEYMEDAWYRIFGSEAPVGSATRMILASGASLGLGWAECGFPTVELGHKLTASLACTSIPEEAFPDIKPPWRCFSIRIPKGVFDPDWGEELLIMFPREGEDAPVRCHTFSGIGISFADEPELKHYAQLDFELVKKGHSTMDNDELEKFARLEAMRGRVLCGVCIEMDDPDRKRQIEAGPSTSKKKGRKRGPPTSWVFKLSRPVKLDVREVVRSYVDGASSKSAPSTQCLVRGHHKRQRCGPGGSDRKWIHIEPYWRGDEDAPIAVRTHKMKG